MFHPTIIQHSTPADQMDDEYFEEVAELILFYLEHRDENPDLEMAEA
jgi:hypothetical protein|tara:strand:- start:212 stop:352 length:141 start_codon:yes stop_codon:yes gene_type:complete